MDKLQFCNIYSSSSRAVGTQFAGDAAGDEYVAVSAREHVRQDALGQRQHADHVQLDQLAVDLQR